MTDRTRKLLVKVTCQCRGASNLRETVCLIRVLHICTLPELSVLSGKDLTMSQIKFYVTSSSEESILALVEGVSTSSKDGKWYVCTSE